MKKAQPIWIANKEREMNVHVVFKTEVPVESEMELHISGTAFYRAYVNGKFLGVGPARTAKGYVREDILVLGDCIENDESIYEVVIEAVGYYCCSLSTVKQPSFVMAEIQRAGKVVAYTGKDFDGYLPGCKIQKVERYSVQRHFTEIWDYRRCPSLTGEAYKAKVEVLPEVPRILDRRVPYPPYQTIDLKATSYYGTYQFDELRPFKEKRYSWKLIPEEWGTFAWDEIPYHPYTWIQRQRQTVTGREKELPITMKKGEYAIFDFGRIEAGFLTSVMESLEESDVIIGFSEFYQGEEFQFTNMNVHNVEEYFLAKGDDRKIQSFEPYTFRHVMVMVKEGRIRLNSFGTLTYMFDVSNVSCSQCDNVVQDAICRAAIRTFAHNAVDLYTDCPSRERAGWLCDSYFTARTEYELTGKTLVEDAFLENYRLYENRGDLLKGVLPECYPADIPKDGEFIPQWTMWYILEAEEYMLKRGHEDMREEFRKSIYDLLHFYRQYENEDGLLEDLPGWNFVEWSNANEWTRNVNYPTNFLYSQVLESIYNLYGDETCRKRSREVRETAVKQSFNGQYFQDHAVRDEEGVLKLQKEASEACQYYAVLFSGIDIHSEKYKRLKHLIVKVFSPDRKGVMPEIMEVNAFIGAYLRMDALLKMKEYTLVLKDVEGFFGKMEEHTGTLWEYRQFKGSYDHGFASYVLVVIREAIKNLKESNVL